MSSLASEPAHGRHAFLLLLWVWMAMATIKTQARAKMTNCAPIPKSIT